MEKDRANLSQGQTLNQKYEILSVIGQGGMGTVYLARQADGTQVAIKELTLATWNTAAKRQFEREAALLSSLEHPGLVKVMESFATDDRPYIVMEFVDGQTLGHLIRQGQPISLDQALEWTLQLCSVLELLHSHKPPILFRDLKPSNVMIDQNGQARLIDFGIARFLVEGQETTTFLKGMGSTGFAPLEQYGEEGGTDERSDIYSLGATLYATLTRKIPESPVTRISSGAPLTPPRRHNPEIPRPFEAVLTRMLALKKESRYRRVSEVREALQRARQGQNITFEEVDESIAPHFKVEDIAYPQPVPVALERQSTTDLLKNDPDFARHMQSQQQVNGAFRIILLLVMTLAAVPCFLGRSSLSLYDYLGIPFDFGGHILGSPLGEFGSMVAGILLPLLLAGALTLGLWFRGQLFSGAMGAVWLGAAVVGQGRLLSNARLHQLSLPGHEDNDWGPILAHFHALREAEAYGRVLIQVGRLGLVVALLLALFSCLKEQSSSPKRV